MTKARDIMTKDVKYIQEDVYISEIVERMKEERVSSFIVERKDQDDAYGIITRKDIINRVNRKASNPYQGQRGRN